MKYLIILKAISCALQLEVISAQLIYLENSSHVVNGKFHSPMNM